MFGRKTRMLLRHYLEQGTTKIALARPARTQVAATNPPAKVSSGLRPGRGMLCLPKLASHAEDDENDPGSTHVRHGPLDPPAQFCSEPDGHGDKDRDDSQVDQTIVRHWCVLLARGLRYLVLLEGVRCGVSPDG